MCLQALIGSVLAMVGAALTFGRFKPAYISHNEKPSLEKLYPKGDFHPKIHRGRFFSDLLSATHSIPQLK